MNSNIKYSFILPAYKDEFLDKSIKSILQQTYTNFELVIINDASPFNLKDIIDKNLDSRIKYFVNKTNTGKKDLVAHWNKCTDYCSGEYFILASDDDIYKPSFLQDIDSLINKYPNVEIFRSRVERIDENDNIFMKELAYEEFQSSYSFFKLFYLYGDNYIIRCIANYVFRYSSFLENGKFTNYPTAWHSDDITVFKNLSKGIVTTQNINFQFRSSKSNISNINNSYNLSFKKMIAESLYYHDINSYVQNYKSLFSLNDYKKISTIIEEENKYSIIKQIRHFHILTLILFTGKIRYPLRIRSKLIYSLLKIALNRK